MRRRLGTRLGAVAVGSLALFGAACADRSQPMATEVDADHREGHSNPMLYVAQLTPLNNSGVQGAAAFAIHNGEFTARVFATGMAPNLVHPQHIHGLPNFQNSTCPGPDAAKRIPNSPANVANPDQLISIQEGLPEYGPVRVHLDNRLTAAGAPGTLPTANAAGVVNYLQKRPLAELQDALGDFQLLPLEEKVVVLHGGFVTGADGQQRYEPSLPVACAEIRMTDETELRQRQENVLVVPAGFRAEKVVGGLSFTTEMAFDDQGRLYVVEAGGGFQPVEFRAPRILRIENGQTHEVINLSNHVVPPVVGLAWDNGWLYFSHRDTDDSGALSRVRDDGTELQKLITGFETAKAEHFMNGVEIRNGWVYFGIGQAGNSAVVGMDIAPFVRQNPGLRPQPCRDLVMRGHNFEGPNFLENGDPVLTGPYSRLGQVRQEGETVAGVRKCGGAIHRFQPDDPEGSLQMVAWGMRQPIGLAFNQQGELFTGENGYDVRGLRPVNDEFDATLRINPDQPGRWYGFPDFSAAREPLTLDKFESPDRLQAPIFRVGQDGSRERLGTFLDFIIDHQASGLPAPDRNLVVGLHPFNSSPSGIDVAPQAWGAMAGGIFVAEWGDLAPPTNPLRERSAGFRVVRMDPNRPQSRVEMFVQNRRPGPASEQGARGQGLERPFDVKFGPDNAMYISDYGIVQIDMNAAPPYRYIPDTGAIWRIVRSGP